MEVQENTLTASLIIHAVSRVTGISTDDIKSHNRKREIVDARKIALFIIYDKCGYSLNRVGKIFDNMHHASIIYSNRSYFDLFETDKEFRLKVLEIKHLLNIL